MCLSPKCQLSWQHGGVRSTGNISTYWLGHRVYVRFSLACAKTQGLGRGIPGYVGTGAHRVHSFAGWFQPCLMPLATGDPAKVARANDRSSTDFGRFLSVIFTGERANGRAPPSPRQAIVYAPKHLGIARRVPGAPGFGLYLRPHLPGSWAHPVNGTCGGRVRPGPGSLVFHGVSGIWINRSDDT